MRVLEIMPPSSHTRLPASQRKIDAYFVESQNPGRKLQNAVTNSNAKSQTEALPIYVARNANRKDTDCDHLCGELKYDHSK